MSAGSTEAAAAGLLATLAAGRAAVLQLGASHLPFSRLVALHAAFSDESARLAGINGLIDRRLDTLRGRLRHLVGPRAQGADLTAKVAHFAGQRVLERLVAADLHLRRHDLPRDPLGGLHGRPQLGETGLEDALQLGGDLGDAGAGVGGHGDSGKQPRA